ncbi:MAG TPA: hypothetical protein VIT20_12020 [Propionibacteriaceae bacterium]
MRRPSWRRPSSRTAFLVALVIALLAASAQGLIYYRDRRPALATHAGVGQPVDLDGTRLQVRTFTVAAELPAQKADKPPVRGPAGSLLVLIVYEQQVDAGVKIDEHFCDTSLVGDDGTIWQEDDTVGYQLRRPEALTCSDSDDQPLIPGVSREIGVSYLVPARYADQLSWRLSLDEDHQVVEFRP